MEEDGGDLVPPVKKFFCQRLHQDEVTFGPKIVDKKHMVGEGYWHHQKDKKEGSEPHVASLKHRTGLCYYSVLIDVHTKGEVLLLPWCSTYNIVCEIPYYKI